MSPDHSWRSTPRFPIGTQFYTRGKHPRLCTVIDVLRTYNVADELVRVRYGHVSFTGGLIRRVRIGY